MRKSEATVIARKILLHKTGPADVLKIESIPTPEPGKGEVRIRVKAIGLNHAEIDRSTLGLKIKQLNITKNIFRTEK